MKILLFLISLSNITIFIAHASEEQKSIISPTIKNSQLVTNHRIIKRAHIAVAHELRTSPHDTATVHHQEIKSCTAAACIVCSEKMKTSDLNW